MTVKNGDMPAMPVFNSDGFISNNESGSLSGEGMGLTKREQFAMAAMQGILSSKHYLDFCNESKRNDKSNAAAEIATKHADALLDELERTK